MKPEEKTFETVAGQEFTFLFDFEGLIAVENCANADPDSNLNLNQILAGAMNRRFGCLRALVYGGLKAHHPGITRAQAAALIDSDGTALGAALWPAFFSAMPEAKGENPPVAARKAGTGSRSSPPGSKKGSTKRASGSRRRGATKSS